MPVFGVLVEIMVIYYGFLKFEVMLNSERKGKSEH